jgi:beta-galactosidase
MKKPPSPGNIFRRASAFLLLAQSALAIAAAHPDPRLHESFDFGWRFLLGDAPGAEQPAFTDTTWRKLALPHDWSIEGPYDENAPTAGPGGYLPTGIGWYRKSFAVPAALRGRKLSVEFDGVYMNSEVWLNGHSLGRWPYGYTSFAYDLTPYLSFGDTPNVLAVRCDNSAQPNSRWYSGSGIYRHTWITITDPLRVALWGTYITTPKVAADAATVRIRTRVKNDRADTASVALVSQIVDAAGQIVATVESTETVAAGAEREFDQTVEVAKPGLWSPDTPTLYRVRTLVQTGSTVVDRYETPLGLRDLAYDVDRGFLLNGVPVKLRGMCVHHDGGAVGAAVPEAVLERRLRLLQAMGCNAIRGSHNPMAPELLDLCDRLGLLVMDEAFDEWTVRKPQIAHGYSEFFAAWAEKDLVNLIHRDRNHPSVVMWSAGNEIGDQGSPTGPDVLRSLVTILHREDPTRPVTAALDNVYTTKGGNLSEAFTGQLDLVGYNYVDRWDTRRETFYADDRRKYPQRKMVGTESVGIGGVRGSYEFGGFGRGEEAAPSTTGLQRARYATTMIEAEQMWKFTRVHDYVIGDFPWTGIDYLGESRWPRKSSTSGELDTCGFPKDGYYFYQSQWTTAPMLHLFPHWNWTGREGQVIPVLAYTNCDSVELFLNGKSYGIKALEFPRQGAAGGWNSYAHPPIYPTTADLHLAWDVPYEPGVLKAIGRKGDQVVCEEEVRTAGAPAALVLSVERDNLCADARDVVHLTVKVVDSAGILVPRADPLIAFDLQGAGALIGLDNGDPTSHEDYKASQRKAFNGLALALVQSTAQPGEIRVKAAADGLRGVEVVLHTSAIPDVTLPVITALDR